jgi:hypothetical protein
MSLIFSRDRRQGSMGLHFSILFACLCSGVIFALASLLSVERLVEWERSPFVQLLLDLFLYVQEYSVYGIGLFILLCMAAGFGLAERLSRYEPAYKGLVVGTAGGALLALLVRSAGA